MLDHRPPLKLNRLARLFLGEEIGFSDFDDLSVDFMAFSLELLSKLDPDVDRALQLSSDWMIMSSSRTSRCEGRVCKFGSRSSMNREVAI